MSFPNSPAPPSPLPPPPPIMPRPFSDCDVGGFCPGLPLNHPGYSVGFPLNHENLDQNNLYSPENLPSYQHFDHAPPLKRQRNSENNSELSAPFPPLVNPRMNPPIPPGSRGTSRIFYKTRMCIKFLEGNCKNGENCNFAHGIEDLREPPPNWQELIRGKEVPARVDQRSIHKMKLCRKFYNGEECPYGEKCNFVHERPIQDFGSLDEWPKDRTDMPMQRESFTISIGTRSATGNASDYDQPVNPSMDPLKTKTVLWKRKLCSKWEITGHCPFGERCHFAHGQSELNVSTAQLDIEVAINSSANQTKPVAVPVFDSSLANAELSDHVIEFGEDKNFPRWRPKRKMNKIYADWLDDQTPAHGSPVEAEDQ